MNRAKEKKRSGQKSHIIMTSTLASANHRPRCDIEGDDNGGSDDGDQCHIRDFNHPCLWKCCMEQNHLKINRKYFWMCMNEMKQCDSSYCTTNRLMYEQSIDLNSKDGNGDDDKSIRSVFCFGLDPENRFQVAARIDIHTTGECLMLNAREFRGLLNVLEFEKQSIFGGSIRQLKRKKKSAAAQNKMRNNIQICSTGAQNKYVIVAHNHSIHIDAEALKRLCIVRHYIERLKHVLEQKSNKCETAFFKLMGHFYYDRTAQEACIACECAEERQKFLQKIINFHCDCLERSFVLEIALNYEIWFGLCIPYFIKTLMLNESERWLTFGSPAIWPHENNKIDTRTLSKSGFYYTGTMDSTICAFCGTSLHDWKEGDIPIVKHFESEPRCAYLVDHTATLNVDNDKPSGINEIMQPLKNM